MTNTTLTVTQTNGTYQIFIVNNLMLTTNSKQLMKDCVENLKRLIHPNEILRCW